jgi:Leucine-rich repeat (LRR) protein
MNCTSRGLILIFLLLSIGAVGQKKTAKKETQQKPVAAAPKSNQEKEEDEKKVRDMISFLEFMLNTLGSSSTPVRDKEVLITESYAKIFRDSKVQIEDDLDEERKVITNKDVVAYLKDVNFFFKQARFEFTIEEIKRNVTPGGEHFYKVTTTRNLTATTADDVEVNNSKPRFIEINYNPQDQDLKIVSIYTHEFDEKLALTNWWNSLSLEWKSVFRDRYNLNDSVTLIDLKTIKSTNELDISNNPLILSLEPLSELNSLAFLTIAGTQVNDLTPIRNLTELVKLDISSTKVNQLAPLKYVVKLQDLNISNTLVTDLSVLSKMTNLKSVAMRDVPVSDFSSLSQLTLLQEADLSQTQLNTVSPFQNHTQLKALNLSETYVQDLHPLSTVKALEILELDTTPIRNLNGCEQLVNLKTLSINHTSISDLTPVLTLPLLEKVYCDQTDIKRQDAQTFMLKKPGTLIIFDSKDLKFWWDSLPVDWKNIFNSMTTINANPSKDELARIPLIDSINIAGQSGIKDIEPLRRLDMLRILIANKTGISDLSPLRSHYAMTYLDVSGTKVKDLTIVSELKALKVLKTEHNTIENITFLKAGALKYLYADHSSINDQLVLHFLLKNPECIVVYKTDRLKDWWNNLSEPWQQIFTEAMGKNTDRSAESLHQLIQQNKLHFKDKLITDLSPLREFVLLSELHFSGTNLSSISPIEPIKTLRSLHATNSPITNLDSLSLLTELEDLDISNTPIDDIYEIWRLTELKSLNCSGTQIKRMDALEKLEKLEYLDCSNTNVSKLDRLDYLPLKTLKCYNTKLSARAVQNFKASHPECNVIYYR